MKIEDFKVTKKLMTKDQVEDISGLILKLAADAFMKKEISKEEAEAIISFTAQSCAFVSVFKEQGLVKR